MPKSSTLGMRALRLVGIAGDEHVLGLDVAVHDALRVGCGDAAHRRHEQREAFADAELPLPEHVAQRLALEQLEHEEHLAVLLLDAVDVDHVRVTDARRRLRFADEALRRARLGGQLRDAAISARRLCRCARASPCRLRPSRRRRSRAPRGTCPRRRRPAAAGPVHRSRTHDISDRPCPKPDGGHFRNLRSTPRSWHQR